jgi:hypothetical protein
MNNTTLEIADIAKVNLQEASEIYEVLLSEYLIDFSEATMREFKQAIKFASTFIANGHSWE